MSAGGDSFLTISAEEEPLVSEHVSERSIYNQSIWGELKSARQVLQEAKWDKTNKGLMGGVACCSCCSVLSFILAFALFFLIGYVVHAGINANAVIDSPDSTGYSLWQTNIDNEAPPEYECYNFFNLTNWEDVAHNRNATPEYQELGPYCYLMNHEKINVTWLDDGNQVNFKLFQNFSWAPQVSRGDAMNDMVINISPGYVGILATVGSEFDLSVAFTGPAFHVNLEWLTTIFVHHQQADSTAKDLTNKQKDLGGADSYFYSTWANATALPDSGWNGMIVSFRGVPSNISMDTTQALWDKKTSYSLLSTNSDSVSLWFNATLPLTGADTALPHLPPLEVREAAQARLQEIFNLTAGQVEMLCDWLRNDFYVEVVDPKLVEDYNSNEPGNEVTNLRDLGWLQWSQCGVQRSAKNEFHLGNNGFLGRGAYLEYGCFPKLGKKFPMTIDQSKKLLNGTYGIFDMNNMGEFFDSWFNATNPLHCPDGSETHFNIGCRQCDNCTQPTCTSNRSGYTCTIQDGKCTNQYNTTLHCSEGDRIPCQQPSAPNNTQCLSCRNCSDFHPTDHDFLSTSNCTGCQDCSYNDTESICECDCQECDVFISCNNTEAWEVLHDKWGLDYEKTLFFVVYILYSEVEFGDPYLRTILDSPHSGLFPLRTVNDWIFNATDPLMFLANPEHPHANNLIQNMSSPEVAQTMYKDITTWTGKDELSKANTYYSYNGNTTIHPPFYPQEVPIEGTTEWGQFQPFLNERDVKDLYSFDPNYFRTIHLVRTGSVKYRDVPLWRFMVSNDTLKPDPTYYQEINGFANSTSFHQMCPIFYSNPHFALANDTYAFRVKGVAENRNWQTDYTVVDVEPNTGMVMHVNMTLQANLFLKEDYRNIRKYYQPPTGVFYPLIIAYKETTLSKDNKALYELTVSFTAWLQLMSFASFFALAFISIVFVLALLIKMVRRNQDAIPLPEDTWNDDQIIQ